MPDPPSDTTENSHHERRIEGPSCAERRRARAERGRDRLQSAMAADRRAGEAQKISDLAAMGRLHELSTRLGRTTALEEILDEILRATMALEGAESGTIHLRERDADTVSMVAQVGFSDEFQEHFRTVDRDHGSACGRALRKGHRIVVEDVEVDEGFAPHLEVCRRAGIRAVQATPMYGRGGEILGVLSTHFREPHRPSERDLLLTDLYLELAAELVDHRRREEELQAARDAAETANRIKSDFMATISHELRTPPNAVIGYTALLLEGVPEAVTPGAERHVKRIAHAARHLRQLIEEVLTFSRLEAGRESFEEEDVSVEEILEEARAVIEPLTKDVGLELVLDADPALDLLRTDPRKLRQILVNLLGNAVKFTDQGTVALRVVPEGGDVLFRVSDTGHGILPEHHDRLFDAFWQVRGTAPGGTGLGLTISKRYARILGGDITVESAPGEGSVFTLRLPLTRD